MQIRPKYLNDPLCKSGAFSLKHPETFDISHAFLPLIVAKLSTFKQVWFFWTTLYCIYVQCLHQHDCATCIYNKCEVLETIIITE